MFRFENDVWKSSVLERDAVAHAFSTRLGGASVLPHTRSMNVGFGRGDDDDTVRRNIELLCAKAGASYDGIVGSAQYHTTGVRYVTSANAGEGIFRDNPEPSDAFVTDCSGVTLIVRTADCTPILIVGEKADSSPVVGAAHAGWKGTVGLIAENLVEAAVRLGALRETVRAAIGPCIGPCHFEVKEDFLEKVASLCGEDFVSRHTERRGDSYFADMIGMNVEILSCAGVTPDRIDVLRACTVCEPDKYHSHRAHGALRGTMGSVIGIL